MEADEVKLTELKQFFGMTNIEMMTEWKLLSPKEKETYKEMYADMINKEESG